jgi:hypothetical protein
MTEDPDELEERREREELADRIGSAFASVPRPDPPVTEGTGPLHEDVEAALAGKPAGEVTAADAWEVRMDLGSLTPPAFAYYLPALLRIVLVDDEYVDALDSSVFGMLTPPDDPSLAEAFDRRIALLDGAQRDALRRYVAWYSEGESTLPSRERALDYWRA